MIKETKLNGFSAIPLEYEVVDGDLSTALGVVSEDGSLKPMLEPKVIMTFLKPSQKVVYIHEATAFHYYIVHDTEGFSRDPNIKSHTQLWYDKTV